MNKKNRNKLAKWAPKTETTNWDEWIQNYGNNVLKSESKIVTHNRLYVVIIRRYEDEGHSTISVNIHGDSDVDMTEFDWENDEDYKEPQASLMIKWDGCVHSIDFQIGVHVTHAHGRTESKCYN